MKKQIGWYSPHNGCMCDWHTTDKIPVFIEVEGEGDVDSIGAGIGGSGSGHNLESVSQITERDIFGAAVQFYLGDTSCGHKVAADTACAIAKAVKEGK